MFRKYLFITIAESKKHQTLPAYDAQRAYQLLAEKELGGRFCLFLGAFLRILHLPLNAGNHPFQLARGERHYGNVSHTLSLDRNWLNYPKDFSPLRISSWRGEKHIWALNYFLRFRNKYDVFHFNYGSSLIHLPSKGIYHKDMGLYPSKAKLFMTYQGCDARQKYPTMQQRKIAACHESGCYKGQCNSGVLDHDRRTSIAAAAPHLSYIWALNPDLLRFLPPEKSSFLPYAVACPNTDIKTNGFFYETKMRPLRIVHAPTNRDGKGTKYLLTAIENLSKRLPNLLELILVENIPHSKALEIYKTADLAVDQLLQGWYGAFAVEAMWLGIPVMARIEKDDLNFIHPEMKSDLLNTIIDVTPDSLEEMIEKILNNPKILRETSRASQEYSRKWHSPERVAKTTLEIYEKSVS